MRSNQGGERLSVSNPFFPIEHVFYHYHETCWVCKCHCENWKLFGIHSLQSPLVHQFWSFFGSQPASSSIQFHHGYHPYGHFCPCSRANRNNCRWYQCWCMVAYSCWWSTGQTVFFLVETDFLSITHVHTYTSQWTHWLASCRSQLPQPQLSWSGRLHKCSHQLNLDFTQICFPWTFQWKNKRHQEAMNISVKFAIACITSILEPFST